MVMSFEQLSNTSVKNKPTESLALAFCLYLRPMQCCVRHGWKTSVLSLSSTRLTASSPSWRCPHWRPSYTYSISWCRWVGTTFVYRISVSTLPLYKWGALFCLLLFSYRFAFCCCCFSFVCFVLFLFSLRWPRWPSGHILLSAQRPVVRILAELLQWL